jgi:hypothetical protein
MTLPCANAGPPPNVTAIATIIDSATFKNVACFIALLLIKKVVCRSSCRVPSAIGCWPV